MFFRIIRNQDFFGWFGLIAKWSSPAEFEWYENAENSVYRRLVLTGTRSSVLYEVSKTMGRDERQGISHWNRHFSNLNCVQQRQTKRIVYKMMHPASTQVWFDAFINIMLRPSPSMLWISFPSIRLCAQRTTCLSLTSPPSFSSAQSSENLSCRFRDERINLFQFARSARKSATKRERSSKNFVFAHTRCRHFAASRNWNMCAVVSELTRGHSKSTRTISKNMRKLRGGDCSRFLTDLFLCAFSRYLRRNQSTCTSMYIRCEELSITIYEILEEFLCVRLKLIHLF